MSLEVGQDDSSEVQRSVVPQSSDGIIETVVVLEQAPDEKIEISYLILEDGESDKETLSVDETLTVRRPWNGIPKFIQDVNHIYNIPLNGPWSEYGINENMQLPILKAQSIETIIDPEELEKLKPKIHRKYLYQPTFTHDLWSILSEILFERLCYAPQIYEAALRMRLEESNYFHYSKLKKRRLHRGQGFDDKLHKRYQSSLRVPYKYRGSVDDLESLARILNISYHVIGTDSNWNFFSKESVLMQEEDRAPPRTLAFYVKLLKKGQSQWYYLIDTGEFEHPFEDFSLQDASAVSNPEIIFKAPITYSKTDVVMDLEKHLNLNEQLNDSEEEFDGNSRNIKRFISQSKIQSFMSSTFTKTQHTLKRLGSLFRNNRINPEELLEPNLRHNP